jgi:hypothetical protein
MSPAEVAARLTAILDGVRRLRRSLYPPDWTTDPWRHVEQELTALLEDMKN